MNRKQLVYSLLVVIGIALLVSCLTGCSATAKIAEAATEVQRDATDIRSEVVQAKQQLAAKNLPAVDQHLTNIDGKAAKVQKTVAEIQTLLPDVQDRTPWWANLIKWGLVTISVVGVIFLLWRFNLLLLVEAAIQWAMTKLHKLLGPVLGA